MIPLLKEHYEQETLNENYKCLLSKKLFCPEGLVLSVSCPLSVFITSVCSLYSSLCPCSSPATVFQRFLSLLANFDWESEPLIVNLTQEISGVCVWGGTFKNASQTQYTMHVNLLTAEGLYRNLPSKRPWALEIHGPINGGKRSHGEAICMYNAYTHEP